jgi:regulator of replication initiation timing
MKKMTPNIDIIKDFSNLQAQVNELSKSNVSLAQENAKLRRELADAPMKRDVVDINTIPTYVTVIDDSDCTVKLGGPGAVYKVCKKTIQFKDYYLLEGVVGPYSKSIFRPSTQEEIDKFESK